MTSEGRNEFIDFELGFPQYLANWVLENAMKSKNTATSWPTSTILLIKATMGFETFTRCSIGVLDEGVYRVTIKYLID